MAEEGGAPKKKVQLTFAGKYLIYFNQLFMSTHNTTLQLIQSVPCKILNRL